MASEFLIVAKALLEQERRPMSPKQLVDLGFKRKLFSDNIAGKTPHQTMKAKLSMHIRQLGERSVFVRSSPSRFFLRDLIEKHSDIYQTEPLKPPPPVEKVLVFPNNWLDEHGRFQGIKENWRKMARELFRSGILTYLDRREAEIDDSWKQVLTYIMVTKGEKVLAFKRGNYNRAEEFLRGAHCIGFGGHVTMSDYGLFHDNDYGIRKSAARELDEEIKLPPLDHQRVFHENSLQITGLLNDDSSKNGLRHFAFLLRYEVSDDPTWKAPTKNEKSITQLRWLSPNESPSALWLFEYWSQLCLLKYYQRAEITKPNFVIRRRHPLRPPHILVLTGPIGSGKSETAQILVKAYGYVEVNSGRVLGQLISMPPVSEKTRESFQKAAHDFIITKDGPFQLAGAIWKELMEKTSDRILIDGIRHRKTLEELRKLALPRRMGLVFVHTPVHVAFDFFRSKMGDLTIHDFIRLRKHPVEEEADGMIAIADAILYNWRGRVDHRRTIQLMMSQMGIEPT